MLKFLQFLSRGGEKARKKRQCLNKLPGAFLIVDKNSYGGQLANNCSFFMRVMRVYMRERERERKEKGWVNITLSEMGSM